MTLSPPTRHRIRFLQTGGCAPRAAPASLGRPRLGICGVSVPFASPSTGHDPHSLTHPFILHTGHDSQSFIHLSLGQDPTNSFIHHHMGHNPPLADSFILHMDTTPLIHPSHGTRPPLTHSSVTQGLTPTHSLITCHMGHDPTDSFIHTSHVSLLLQLFRRGIKD